MDFSVKDENGKIRPWVWASAAGIVIVGYVLTRGGGSGVSANGQSSGLSGMLGDLSGSLGDLGSGGGSGSGGGLSGDVPPALGPPYQDGTSYLPPNYAPRINPTNVGSSTYYPISTAPSNTAMVTNSLDMGGTALGTAAANLMQQILSSPAQATTQLLPANLSTFIAPANSPAGAAAIAGATYVTPTHQGIGMVADPTATPVYAPAAPVYTIPPVAPVAYSTPTPTYVAPRGVATTTLLPKVLSTYVAPSNSPAGAAAAVGATYVTPTNQGTGRAL